MSASVVHRELVGIDQSCQILGNISPWTLRSWAYKGKIASHKIGSRLMFDRAELDRIIADSERPRLIRPASKVSAYETRGPIIIGGDGE